MASLYTTCTCIILCFILIVAVDARGKKPLANPKGMRSASDWLDNKIWKGQYKDNSRVRGFIHGVWHNAAGFITRNPREHERAKEQYKKVLRRNK
jgi:hypothetical protein